ncbi:MAG: FliM/FliN family flagellar motor switch protein, partial [Gemmobacter sp.]
GRLTGTAAPPRRPTRTDAAMVVSTLDRCLRDLEIALAEAPDLSWAGGFHYASFLDDPRPLGLLLDDQPYRVLSAEVTLDDGAGRGSVLLALPAAGRGPKPAPRSAPPQDAAAAARAWSQAMAQAVNGAEVQLDAVMGRIRVPLEQVMGLEPGALIPIGAASLDSVALEAAGGRRVADARLGQNRGMRALRLTRLEELGPPRPAPVPAVTQPAPDPARAAPALARSA